MWGAHSVRATLVTCSCHRDFGGASMLSLGPWRWCCDARRRTLSIHGLNIIRIQIGMELIETTIVRRRGWSKSGVLIQGQEGCQVKGHPLWIRRKQSGNSHRSMRLSSVVTTLYVRFHSVFAIHIIPSCPDHCKKSSTALQLPQVQISPNFQPRAPHPNQNIQM